jgi:DNA (cytosine-5)-methyltransferase 1
VITYEFGTNIRYLSVCDGIGAVHVAWQPLGWSCVGVSEIAPFPKAVVKHHWGIRSLGDIKRFDEWPERLLADVDLLAGGTPCQAFSVAGKRLGLADERGILTLEFVMLFHRINRIRRKYGRPPAIVLWENVDGAVTMPDNAFGCLLGGLLGCDKAPRTKSGKWHKAGLVSSETLHVGWRICDSVNFAVAQRRKRVFLLGVPRELVDHYGERACPSRILSLRSSGGMKPLTLQAASGITQSESIAKPSESVGGSSTIDLPWLKGVHGSFSLPHQVNLSDILETGPVDPKLYLTHKKAWKTLRRAEVRGKRLPPIYERVLTDIAYGTRSIAGELAAYAAMKDGDRVALSFDGLNQSGSEEVYHTLRVGRDSSDAVFVVIATSEVAGTLTATRGNGFRSNGLPTHGVAIEGNRARTMTPIEWERLMGLPDGYTLVPYRKNELAKDSPRFTGLGNSIVAPILNWIGQRITSAFTPDNSQAQATDGKVSPTTP